MGGWQYGTRLNIVVWFICIVIIPVFSQDPPFVTVEQSLYHVQTGNTVTLVCNVSSSLPLTDVEWEKNSNGTITTINSNATTVKYSGSTTNTPSLTIFYAELSDAGIYTCFASDGFATGESDTTTLMISEPPFDTVNQSLYYVQTGTNVTLVCNVSSSLPLIGVEWEKNSNGTITTIYSDTNTEKYGGSTTNTPSLTIFYAELSDAGIYTCFASNSDGTGEIDTATLMVSDPPFVAVEQSLYYAQTGNTVTLVCNVSSSLPLTSVEWEKNSNGTITTINTESNTEKYSGSSTNTPSLTIFYAELIDAGIYTCFASNSDGTGESDMTTLMVSEPPFITVNQSLYYVQIGNMVTLMCDVSSSLPLTDVEWEKNSNGTITTINTESNTEKYSGSSTNTPSLSIFYAELSDAGIYTCFASNSDGTGESDMTTLIVSDPPFVTVNQSLYYVQTGNMVTLVCNVSSSLPLTDVQWEKNSNGTITTINTESNTEKYSGSSTNTPSLTIFYAELSDAGIYTCFASNSDGTGESDMTTLIVSEPPFITVNQSLYYVQTGNMVTLVCDVSSSLLLTDVEWEKNSNGTITTINTESNTEKYSGSSTNTPSLTIFYAELSDAGIYTCFASNSDGTGESDMTTLIVSDPPFVTVNQSLYYVQTGNMVTLVCNVSSSLPLTDVEWEKNSNGTITTINTESNTEKYSGSSTNTPSLTIFYAELSDAGIYTCFASNSDGTGESDMTTLMVSDPPFVTVNQSLYYVQTGNMVTLVCNVSSSLPLTDVQWEKNSNGTITTINTESNTEKYSGSSTNTPSLTIFYAELSDAGIYTCFASNSDGTGESDMTTLIVSEPPFITVNQSLYYVQTGNMVTLVCDVSSSLPLTDVEWEKNSNGTITTINTESNTEKYSGSSTNTPSLTIFYAELSDAGIYTCFASNSDGTRESDMTTLIVSDPPVFTVEQSLYYVQTGNNVTLSCNVSSSLPLTAVEWEKNSNGTITTINSNTNTEKYSGSSTNTPSLTIFYTELSDAGIYTCFASNSDGTGESDMTTLMVSDPPFVTVNQSLYYVQTGNMVTLVCNVSSSLPLTDVQWEKNSNGTITTITTESNTEKYSGSSTNTPSLTIFYAELSDAGIYTCFASNSDGTGESDMTTLIVSDPPFVTVNQSLYYVQTGNMVTLVCNVSSSLPLTDVEWEKNSNHTITTITTESNTEKYSGSSTNTPSLTIFYAELSDAGIYTCFASNSDGTGESDMTTLIVSDPPFVTVNQSLYYVQTGNMVTLVCNVSSSLPLTDVQWEKNSNGTITTITTESNTEKYSGSSTNTPSLTIFYAELSDAGIYTCFASNSDGTGESDMTTLIVSEPPFITVNQSLYYVQTGNTVTLVCDVYSSLPLTDVEWEKNSNGTITTINTESNTEKYSGSSTNTPSLTIFYAELSDAGIYTCFASNSDGTGESDMTTLIVSDPPVFTVEQSLYYVQTGNNVTLSCNVSSSLPLTAVEWEKNSNGTITTINSNTNTEKYSGSSTNTPSLTIFYTELSDAGIYTCFASNSDGTGESDMTTLMVSDPPFVTVNQSLYYVQTGNMVTLVCNVSSSLPLTDVQWEKNSNGTITTITTESNTEKYSGSSTNTPSLTIFYAELSDAGIYTCFASNSDGTGESDMTTLIVSDPPFVTVNQSLYYVQTGNMVTLVCNVSSSLPLTDVEWEKNSNHTITTITTESNTEKYSGSSTNTPSLTIFYAELSDAGIYTCFASNSDGTGESDMTTLIVSDPPFVTVNQSLYYVQTGNMVTLVCNVSSSLPLTDVQWEKNSNGTITTITTESNTEKYSGSSTNTPSLTIFYAELSDAGIYTCFASNSDGTGESDMTTLIVSEPPFITVNQSLYYVQTGNTVTLVCDVYSSLPLTDVEWEKNSNGTITTINTESNTEKYSGSSTNTPSLTIFYAELSDAGIYTCFASNSDGTGESDMTTLIVSDPPVFTVEQSLYYVQTGNNVTLSCNVSSSLPLTAVEWEKNSNGTITTINSNTNTEKYSGSSTNTPSLTIFYTELSDAGIYTCFASNSDGTGESDMTTLMVSDPPFVTVNQSLYYVQTGNTVTLVCNVSSSLPLTDVQWEKNSNGTITTINTESNTEKYSGSSTNTPSLTIFYAELSDAGIYTCFASNSDGTGESDMTTLMVSDPPFLAVEESLYYVQTGNTVTLVCNVSSSLPLTDVEWEKNSNGIITTINSTTNTEKYSGSTTNTPSLTIFYAELSDAGIYTCFASNSDGTGESDMTTLIVSDPPFVLVEESLYYVQTGNTVKLVCNVSSSLPLTSVEWEKNSNGTITTINTESNTEKYSGSSTNTPSLTIFYAELSDAGIYTCFASNSDGTGESDMTTLMVSDPPFVLVEESLYYGQTGNTVTLVCNVSSSLPLTSVEWEKNSNGTITTINTESNTEKYSGSSTNTPSLTIFYAELSDAGIYTCFASNSDGTGESDMTTLMVSDPPFVLVEESLYYVQTGNTVKLVCNVSSSLPLTNVEWEKNNNGTITTINTESNTEKYSGSSTNTPSLTIFYAELSDAGIYTCFASNSDGTRESDMTTLMVSDPPFVLVEESLYYVQTGNTVKLVCNVSSSLPLTSVEWEKNSNGTITTINTESNTEKYSGSSTNTPSLTIFYAELSDAGIYTCFASNSDGTGESDMTTLMVSDPPFVLVEESLYYVQTGNTVKLVCNVSSSLPLTSVEWEKNSNGTITTINTESNTEKYSGSSTNTPSLTIFYAELSDAGIYTCFASNSDGTGESDMTTLMVSDPPFVLVEESLYYVQTGNTVKLVCNVSSSLPLTSVEWEKNSNGTITTINTESNTEKYSGSSTNTPSLTIFYAELSDAGIYTCFASNSDGTGESDMTTLMVSDPPFVLVEESLYYVQTGNTVTLVCNVSSSLPLTSVEWEKNSNGTITTINTESNTEKYSGSYTNTPSLTIFYAELSDAGIYTCFASNSDGTGESDMTTLMVSDPPFVLVEESLYYVQTGNIVTLVCNVSSSLPLTSVEWEKNSNGTITTINTESNTEKYSGSSTNTPSLTIFYAELSDAGIYTCFASNSDGTGESDMTTLMVSDPPFVLVEESLYYVQTGNTVKLVCNVSSSLPLTSVEWEKNSNGTITTINTESNTEKYSGSSTNTPSLTIFYAELSDAGIYTCFASNSDGTGESDMTTLMVSDPPFVLVEESLYYVQTGNTVTLVCNVSSSLPLTSVEWEKNSNGTITTINTESNTEKYSGSYTNTPSLTIFYAELSDAGIYTCFASNSDGTGESDMTTLMVSDPPFVLVEESLYYVQTGNIVTLVCNVSSSLPLTSVEWEKNSNGTITTINTESNTEKYSGSSTNTPSLTIFYAELSDAGIYTCFASNSDGTGESDMTTLMVSDPPFVLVEESLYYVQTGNTVKLVCNVSSSLPLTSVEWEKNSNGTITTINTESNTEKYSGSSTNTPSLTIFYAELSDAGIYTCFASNSDVTGESDMTTLMVSDPPFVLVEESLYYVQTGNTVKLVCNVSSSLPLTSVEWEKNSNGTITTINTESNTEKYSGSSTNTPSLTIFYAELSDAGIYTCFASNSDGTGESDMTTLMVSDPPFVLVEESLYYVQTGNTVKLVCNVSSSLPLTSVEWEKNSNGTITTINTESNTEKYSGSSTNTPSLTIFYAELSDAGIYTCFASYSDGTGESDMTTLMVSDPPFVLVEESLYYVQTGNTVKLVCNVYSSLPLTSVEWEKNSNGTITTINTESNTEKYSGSSTNTPSLTIFYAELSDAGIYTCFASNSDGTGESDMTTLMVSDPPFVLVEESLYYVQTGNTVKLVCNVSSSLPLTSVEWEKNSNGTITTINSNTNTKKYSGSTTNTPSLTIFYAELSDTGIYICLASKSDGTEESDIAALMVSAPLAIVCSPIVSMPDFWIRFDCGIIDMNCTDPTALETSHLQYTFDGLHEEFSLLNVLEGVFNLCLHLTTSRSYQLSVTVSNGETDYRYDLPLEVQYRDSTPWFKYLKYTVTISEDTAIETSIIQVHATTNKGFVVYTVQDPYASFEINYDSGVIRSVASVRPYVEHILTLTVEAMNDMSQLVSSVEVEIIVSDINEPPVCNSTIIIPEIVVYIPVGTVIIKIICQDPDVLEEYKYMNFSLQADEAANQYFDLVTVPGDISTTLSISIKEPLSVRIPNYNIDFAVRERTTGSGDENSANKEPVILEPFAISVDLMPPAPLLHVTVVNSTTIRIHCYYKRSDFYNITEYFILEIGESLHYYRGDAEHSDEFNVQDDTVHMIQLIAETNYGRVFSEAISVKTPVIPILSNLVVSFKLTGEEFNNHLLDSKSQEYINLTKKVTLNMEAVLKRTPGFVSAAILGFKSGSVIVNSLVTVNQTGDVTKTSAILQQYVSSGVFGNLSVEPRYNRVSLGDGDIQVVSLHSNRPFYEGTMVQFFCEVDLIGSVGNIDVSWKLNNSKIRPTSLSRWRIETVDVENTKKYRLTVDPLRLKDSGVITCNVSDGYKHSAKSIDFQVIGKPVVSISPPTKVVNHAESVTIECRITSVHSVMTSIIWYKDGLIFSGSQDEKISPTSDDGTEALTNSNVQNSVVYGCIGRSAAGDGQRVTSNITVILPGALLKYCPEVVDSFGIVWERAIENVVVVKLCGGELVGTASRVCNTGVWGSADYSLCINKKIMDLNDQSDKLKDGVEVEEVNTLLKTLTNLTSKDQGKLTSGDLITSSSTLVNIADHALERPESLSSTQLAEFISSTDNLLDKSNSNSWKEAKNQNLPGVTALVKATSKFSEAFTEITKTEFKTNIQADNLFVEVAKVKSRDIVFPDRSKTVSSWMADSTTKVHLKKSSLADLPLVGYSSVYYRNISDLFLPYMVSENKVKSIEGILDVNSDIIDFGIVPALLKLDPPLVVEFQYLDGDHANPICGFWDFSQQGISDGGAWSTRGSRLVKSTKVSATCEFDHATNFAILMSPAGTPKGHELTLSLISSVGCGISLLFLIITVIIYFVLWRQLKSGRIKILLNLCVALILTYIFFLFGVPRTEIPEVCTTMAVILHYVLLVDFCLMMAMGIEVAYSVLYVMPSKSRKGWLLPAAWIAPAIIVAISMGATQLKGYGNSKFCWLSTDSGLLWAFAGPALLIIVINLVILVLVMRVMFKSMKNKPGNRQKQKKSKNYQVRAGIRSICVLAPLFGITWIFGIISLDSDLVAFQYLFAILNSLQGFFIFLFHCCMDKKVMDGIRHKQRRRKSALLDSSSFSSSKLKKKKKKDLNFVSNNNDSSEFNTSKTSLTTVSFESPSNDKGKNLNNNNDAGKITNNFGGMQGQIHNNATKTQSNYGINQQRGPSPMNTGVDVDVGYNPVGRHSPSNRHWQQTTTATDIGRF